MSVYTRKINWSLPWVILSSTVLLLGILSYIAVTLASKSFFEKEGPFWLFVVGLVPGLAVALMQFLLSWTEFRQISKFSKMRIKGVLNSRDGEAYYGAIIATAETKIDVQGVTASRFVSDFADATSGREDKKVLITALNRGVKVRFLLPESKHLSESDRAEKFPLTARVLKGLMTSHANLEVRYFDHKPTTSTVRIDDDVLVGPVFENVESRHTPAIHTSSGSALAQSYLNHFDSEWATARTMPSA